MRSAASTASPSTSPRSPRRRSSGSSSTAALGGPWGARCSTRDRMLPFWVSIGVLGLLPAGSIAVVVGAIELEPGAADLLTWLALFTVPPLAALALGWLLRGSRPWWSAASLPLFAVAWAAASGTLVAEGAATALTALACVALGWLLASAVPARWLRVGIYAMATLDTCLIAADLLQGPNSLLSAAAPAGLPSLQAVSFGAARMGFGDLFVAALAGCMLAAH